MANTVITFSSAVGNTRNKEDFHILIKNLPNVLSFVSFDTLVKKVHLLKTDQQMHLFRLNVLLSVHI
jgi:hypothetical protein